MSEDEPQILPSLPPIKQSVAIKDTPFVAKMTYRRDLTPVVEPKLRSPKKKIVSTILETRTYNFTDMPEPKKVNTLNGKPVKARSNCSDFTKLNVEPMAAYTFLEYSPLGNEDLSKRKARNTLQEPLKVFPNSKNPKPLNNHKRSLTYQEPMYNIYVPKKYYYISERSKEIM